MFCEFHLGLLLLVSYQPPVSLKQTKPLKPFFSTIPRLDQVNKNWEGPTEILTRIAGFKVRSANHYTIGPLMMSPKLITSFFSNLIYFKLSL